MSIFAKQKKDLRGLPGLFLWEKEAYQGGSVMFRILLPMIFMVLEATTVFASDMDARLNSLEAALNAQQRKIEEQQQLIDRLKEETRRQTIEKASEKALPVAKDEAALPAETEIKVTGALAEKDKSLKNPAITFVLNSFYHASSLDEGEMRSRGIAGVSNKGPNHKKGFNVEEGSVALFAPVDDYFDLFSTLSFTDSGSLVEEAYFYTKSLPAGLRVKGGKFKSNFSAHNELHPHDWDFADAPLAYRGFLSRDGLIEKGAQLTYRPSLPFKSLIGVEALQGENEVIFNKNGTGGTPAFTAYAKGFHEFGKNANLHFGLYVISGQTRTDSVADGTLLDGRSVLSGFEILYKWKPSDQRSLTIQGEYMLRSQEGNLQNTALGIGNRLVRSQDGAYIQSLYQMGKWRIGARYDRLNIFTDAYRLDGLSQHFSNPWRLTGALEFNPSDYSRFRLQYNFDRSGGGPPASGEDAKPNHEIFLQMVFAIGAHAEPAGMRD